MNEYIQNRKIIPRSSCLEKKSRSTIQRKRSYEIINNKNFPKGMQFINNNRWIIQPKLVVENEEIDNINHKKLSSLNEIQKSFSSSYINDDINHNFHDINSLKKYIDNLTTYQLIEPEYANFCSTLTSDDNISFGIELEVVFSNDEKKNHCKKEVEEKQEDFLKIHNNCKKWEAEEDASLGNCGIEWVSPILFNKPEYWQQIELVSKTIRDNNGRIEACCSEHIHVGHKILQGNNSDKFKNLFYLYKNFQDVLEPFFKCGFQQIRSGANDYAKKNDPKEPSSTRTLETQLLFHSFTFAHRILNTTEKQEIHSAINELKKMGNIDMEKLSPLWNLLESIEIIKSEEKNNMITLITKVKNMEILNDAYSFYFTGNPFEADERKHAINIYQNFVRDRYKPTIEFRRFNGTLSENIIQANVLLSTLLVKAAKEKSEKEIQNLIKDCEIESNETKALMLIDFITSTTMDKNILMKAYKKNATIIADWTSAAYHNQKEEYERNIPQHQTDWDPWAD